MQKVLNKLFLSLIVVAAIGCATVEDVQRGSDIIQIDNELIRILENKQDDPQTTVGAELTQIGDHAKKKGDTLKNVSDKASDALAYYRIAATAYWKSNNPDVTNRLFAVCDSGIEVCNAMGANAPDRDCSFLQLVIEFAGLESFANEKHISALLDEVVFSDGNATAEEIKTMNDVGIFLNQVKPRVESILAIGRDEHLFSHPGMHEYYCDNAKAAKDFFDGRTGTYKSKVFQFENSFPGHDPALEMSLEQAERLGKLENELPRGCSR